MFVFLAVFSLLQGFIVGEQQQDKRIWNADTNFDNPGNWVGGRLPCSKDRVVFAPDVPVAVLVSGSGLHSLPQQMVLPTDGELIFGVGEPIGARVEENCLGEDVHFLANRGSWFDPDKWNVSSAYSVPADDSVVRNMAVPHAFRIPCKTDVAVFPRNISFAVTLGDDDVPITVGDVQINGVRYQHEVFQAFLASREGSLLFQGRPRITVSGLGCDDVTGCPCSNDDRKVMRKVCSLIKCPDLECSEPVKPDGHCCPICGTFLKFRHEVGFEMNRLGNVIKSHLSKSKYPDVHSFTGKTIDGSILTVFVDAKQHTGYANQVARELFERIKRDLETSNSNRLKTVEIFASGDWFDGVSSSLTQGLSGVGKAFLVTFLTLVTCISLAWYIRRRRRIPGFSFARFDFHSSKIELELGTTPHEDLSPEGSRPAAEPTNSRVSDITSKCFDNPIYGTEGVVTSAVAGNEDIIGHHRQETGDAADISKEIGDDENVVENPMYMIFESSTVEQEEKTLS